MSEVGKITKDTNTGTALVERQNADTREASASLLARRVSRADSVHLSRSVQLEETDPPRALTGAVRLIFMLIIAFVVWASITPFAEKVAAPGMIQPNIRVQPVQSVTSGKVAEVVLADGAKVTKGSIILRMDDSQLVADRDQALAGRVAAALEQARLRAEMDGDTPDFTLVQDANSHVNLVAAATGAFRTSVLGREAEKRVLMAQRDAAAASAEGLREEVAALADQTAALQETMDTRQTLLDNGVGSRLAYLEARQRYSEIASDLAQRRTALAGADVRLAEVEQQLVAQDALFMRDSTARIETLTTDIARFDAELTSLNVRIAQTRLASPIDGIVSGLTITQAGRVVSAGEVVASVVPSGQTLMGQVRINPRDIGQIVVGQPVLVRIDGYRFGRVGGIDGRVARIAADPSEDEAGNRFFYAWIELDQPYVGDDPSVNPVLSGMTITADVRIGEKSLMSYLIRPIRQSIDAAFSER